MPPEAGSASWYDKDGRAFPDGTPTIEADSVIVKRHVHAAAWPGHWSDAMQTHNLPMPVRVALPNKMVWIVWAFAVAIVAGTDGATMATARDRALCALARDGVWQSPAAEAQAGRGSRGRRSGRGHGEVGWNGRETGSGDPVGNGEPLSRRLRSGSGPRTQHGPPAWRWPQRRPDTAWHPATQHNPAWLGQPCPAQ